MWNDNPTTVNETDTQCLQINCNNNNYNVGSLSGVALVDKLKSIARENHISKYDVHDSTGGSVTPEEIENGEFTGPLTIIRFNVAALL